MANDFSKNIILNYEQIRIMDPMELTQNMVLEYMRQVPTRIDSPDDLNNIGNLLGELANAKTKNVKSKQKIWRYEEMRLEQ